MPRVERTVILYWDKEYSHRASSAAFTFSKSIRKMMREDCLSE